MGTEWKGALLALALGFAAAPAARAQDVVKVAGDTHKVLLENERVRVLEVVFQPGQKAAMHTHPAYVIYALTDGRFRFTLPGGKTVDRDVKAGGVVWSGEPSSHAAENIGTAEVRLIQTELKAAAKKKGRRAGLTRRGGPG